MDSLSMTRRGDVITVPASTKEAFEREGWVPTQHAEATTPTPRLAGEALNAALRDAGLPTTGKADEKRQRLAEALVPTVEAIPVEADSNTEPEEATR